MASAPRQFWKKMFCGRGAVPFLEENALWTRRRAILHFWEIFDVGQNTQWHTQCMFVHVNVLEQGRAPRHSTSNVRLAMPKRSIAGPFCTCIALRCTQSKGPRGNPRPDSDDGVANHAAVPRTDRIYTNKAQTHGICTNKAHTQTEPTQTGPRRAKTPSKFK